jgi:hypothetical protein
VLKFLENEREFKKKLKTHNPNKKKSCQKETKEEKKEEEREKLTSVD